MRLFDIILAYQATEEFAGNKEFTPAEQWAIYTFRKNARTHIEFFQEREKALKDKYSEFADADGNLQQDKGSEYVSELNEVGNLDVEFDFEKPTIRLVQGIDFTTIEKLDKFFNFEV